MDELYLIKGNVLSDIADSIRGKTGGTDSIPTKNMASEINGIQVGIDTSDATATPDKVLNGDIFYDKDGRQVGTMPNNGAVSKSLSIGESYIIPKGYHPGTGRVASPYIKLQTFYTGPSEPSADLGVAGDLYFMTDSGDSGSSTTPTLISFTYTGSSQVEMSLQAEEGMTWVEWCSSSYNENSGLYIDNSGNVFDLVGKYYIYNSTNLSTPVKGTDIIISGGSYELG